MNDSTAGERTIAKSMTLEILTSKVKLPPIPTNGTKLINMVQGPMDDIEISDFAKLVEMDPGLLTSLLKLANSSYYGGVVEIMSLKDAISRIGLIEAIDSVCFYLFKGIMPRLPVIEGFSSKSYWEFAWTCAQANRRLGHPNLGMDVIPGQLYLAGLLQGIGKIMLAIHYPDDFGKCLGIAQKSARPLSVVEKEVFGTTDSFVAANILEAWSLPKMVCETVAYSQTPENAPEEFRLYAALTQLSYAVAQETGIGKSGDGRPLEIESAYICRLKNIELSKPAIRDSVIREIKAVLEEKSRATAEEKGPEKSPRQPASAFKDRPQPQPIKKKKGLFSMIKGWFS